MFVRSFSCSFANVKYFLKLEKKVYKETARTISGKRLIMQGQRRKQESEGERVKETEEDATTGLVYGPRMGQRLRRDFFK